MPKDPVPWAQRRESAKRAHEAQFPEQQDGRGEAATSEDGEE